MKDKPTVWLPEPKHGSYVVDFNQVVFKRDGDYWTSVGSNADLGLSVCWDELVTKRAPLTLSEPSIKLVKYEDGYSGGSEDFHSAAEAQEALLDVLYKIITHGDGGTVTQYTPKYLFAVGTDGTKYLWKIEETE